MIWRKWIATDAPSAVFLIRLLVGGIFLSEGIQKLLFPDLLGVGRFAKIGIPAPQMMAPFVGVVEIVCGALLLIGLLTRLAAIPLLITICVALLSTKAPVLLGHGFWWFSLPKLQTYGVWSMLHEARADLSMLLCLVFLTITGAGSWSADTHVSRSQAQAQRVDV